MGSFDKEKFEASFNPKRFELEKIQSSELRSLIDKHRSTNTLDTSSFYDRRIEMKMRHLKDIIDLATHTLIGSIAFKTKIEDDDKIDFEAILKEIFSNYVEHEKSSIKAAMVSDGNVIDSDIVTESVKAYEKQLGAVMSTALEMLPTKIINHNNNLKLGSAAEVKVEASWKKYSALILIGIVVVVVCLIVLYLII
jgi:hypothetical protein